MLRLGYCWAPALEANATATAAAPKTRITDIGIKSPLGLPGSAGPMIAADLARVALQELGQPLAPGLVAHRLDMPGVGHHPELLRLARALVEPLRMVRRDDQVLLAVDEQHRDRRQRLDRGDRRKIVVHRHAGKPLERPGEEEPGHLLADDQAIVGERAVEDDGAHALAERR